MVWDTSMPSDVTDGDLMDEGDIDPILTNLTHVRFANVLIGGIERITADASTSGTTEKIWATTPTLALDAASTYEVEAGMKYSSTVAADDYVMRIREDNISGAIRIAFATTKVSSASTGYWLTFKAFFKTTGAVGAKQFVGTIQRLSGTGTCPTDANSYLVVRRVGTSTVLATV